MSICIQGRNHVYIAIGLELIWSRFVYSNYLYVHVKDQRCQVYEWYVIPKSCNEMSCNVMWSHECHAKSCKVMQGKQAGWDTHLLCQFYSPVTVFHLYSGFFRRLDRSSCLPQVVSGIQIGLFMLFLPETQSLFPGHFRNPLPSNIGFAQLMNTKGHGLRIQIEATW